MDNERAGFLLIALAPALLSVLAAALQLGMRSHGAADECTLPGWLAVYVESDAGDRRIVEKCSELARYAGLVAGALCGPLPARTR